MDWMDILFNQETAQLFHICFLQFTLLLLANCDKSSGQHIGTSGSASHRCKPLLVQFPNVTEK